MISRLHYISQAIDSQSHLEMIARALDAGVDWVQLRIKDAPKDYILEQAKEAVELCSRYDAMLIINDHIDIAKEVGADGVHLGLGDGSVSEARALLGESAIIGGTCNTLEDVIRRTKEGVDYIGLGPFNHTETKKNLSPVLGLSGYRKIIAALNQDQLKTPVIAIGGIGLEDISGLRGNGVYGIALASLINESQHPKALLKDIKKQL